VVVCSVSGSCSGSGSGNIFLHQVLANATAMMRNHEGDCVSGRINILMDEICSIEHENRQMWPFPAEPLALSAFVLVLCSRIGFKSR
jgi:hypothetical protein